MSVSLKNTAFAGALALAAQSAAHGIVKSIVADGKYNLGYDPAFQYQRPPPSVAGWSIPTVQDRGFVSDLNGPDIVCHRGATPGQEYVKVAAGGTLAFQWTEWPVSHHGPVLDYLAPCGEDCTTVEKTSLKFIKVDQAGLNSGDPAPGNWASDDMIANNNTWTVKVPSDVKAGRYVWRHETIALHSAHEGHGAQPYPQCVNVEITGSGTNDMSGGIPATELYSWEDPGIALNIYYPPLKNYTIPGPPLMSGGSSGSGSKPPTTVTTSSAGSPSGDYSALPVSPDSSTSEAPSSTTSQAESGWGDGAPTDSAQPVKPVVTSTANYQQPASSTTTSSRHVRPSHAPPQGPPPSSPPAPPANNNPQEPPVVPNNPMPQAPPQGPPQPPNKPPTDTPPVSFTSTFTGRIGKPTKFTCYLEED